MSAFKKGQEYRPPYDKGNDAEAKAAVGLDRDSYYPSRTPNVYTSKAGPSGRMLDNTIDLSAAIDKQPSGYFHAFDNDKSADFSKLKSSQAEGGFAGVAGRSTNHPKKGSGV